MLANTTTSKPGARRTFRKDTNGNLNIGEIFAILILLVIGLALVPTIMESTEAAQENATGATSALIGLLPLIFVIILIVGAVSYVRFRGHH